LSLHRLIEIHNKSLPDNDNLKYFWVTFLSIINITFSDLTIYYSTINLLQTNVNQFLSISILFLSIILEILFVVGIEYLYACCNDPDYVHNFHHEIFEASPGLENIRETISVVIDRITNIGRYG